MLIMWKNTIVVAFDVNTGECKIFESDKLPYQLRGALSEDSLSTKLSVLESRMLFRRNTKVITEWLDSRLLPLSRTNANKLCKTIYPNRSKVDSVSLALATHAVSVLDNYWVKTSGSKSEWEDVNVWDNRLSEAAALIALHGESVELSSVCVTPEFTTGGTYAKAWQEVPGRGLTLYKSGNGNSESVMTEYMVSNLLSKMNVSFAQCTVVTDAGVIVTACPAVTNVDLSVLSGEDFISYCMHMKKDPWEEMFKIDAESLYKMFIVDYLIANPNRNRVSWGFYYDAATMQILRCHPLFNHNDAFESGTMQNKDYKYTFMDGRRTMREMALEAIEHVNFRFTQPITRDDFRTATQFLCFKQRAEELGLW